MADAGFSELVLVILGFVESDDSCYIEVLEDLEIVLRRVASSVIPADIVERTHEGDELVGDDPVQVAILDLLVVLVLFVVELPEVVPA